MQPPSGRRPTFLSVYIRDTDVYVQSKLELVRDNAPTVPYNIFIYADKRPTNEHVRCYNRPSCSEGAALIPGNEDGMICKRDISQLERE